MMPIGTTINLMSSTALTGFIGRTTSLEPEDEQTEPAMCALCGSRCVAMRSALLGNDWACSGCAVHVATAERAAEECR